MFSLFLLDRRKTALDFRKPVMSFVENLKKKSRGMESKSAIFGQAPLVTPVKKVLCGLISHWGIFSIRI